ncbi:MAG TPA: group I intron-associated PD-(D/E)XK endonuclease [Solirubrobacteraceae bacterium]
MSELKRKGDLAELAVALDLRRRGYGVAFPFGEASAYDLIVERGDKLERVQVKHARSDGAVLVVRCYSQTVIGGKAGRRHKYTAAEIEWLAVYDATTATCYYVPAAQLGDGRSVLYLRLVPARSGRRRGIRLAEDYLDL